MKRSRRRSLVVLVIIVFVIVMGIVFLNANMLFPWQQQAKANKKAALEYIAEYYPTSEITGADYETMKFNWTAIGMDTFYLESDGICFSLITQSEKVIRDTFYEAKAEKYIRENFIDGFMNERGLSPEVKTGFVHNPYSYDYGNKRHDSLENIYSFTGSVDITITQAHIDGVSTPKDVGWFYDFYQYWMENCDLDNCTVRIQYRRNYDYAPNYSIWFRKGVKTFSNEDEFYNSFRIE